MVTFEEAGAMLDAAADALPREIFDKLNGGVNLLPATKTDSDGLLIMGMYFNDQMGRHIELYYGSFRQAFPNASPEKCRKELTKTLKHELTHHVENLAWDKTLEKWDDVHKAQLLEELYGDPLDAQSVIFVCYDNAALSPMAEELFRLESKRMGAELRCASAGLAEDIPQSVSVKAAAAVKPYGADISRHIPRRVTSTLLDEYDAILCMTEEQCEELALMFPALDPKIMCLGDRDILPPLIGTAGAWRKTAAKLMDEAELLARELCGADER